MGRAQLGCLRIYFHIVPLILTMNPIWVQGTCILIISTQRNPNLKHQTKLPQGQNDGSLFLGAKPHLSPLCGWIEKMEP